MLFHSQSFTMKHLYQKKAYKNFFDEYLKLLNTIKNKGRSNAKKGA